MKIIAIAGLFLIMLVVSAAGQDADVARVREAAQANVMGTRPAASPFALFDLSRLRFSNSYSISFMSGGSGSGSMGLLNTNIFYEFSPSLSMSVDIGVMHNAGTIWGDVNNQATVLPGFRLDYHPSDKFSMTIGVSRGYYSPGYYSPYSGNWLYPR